MNFQTLKYIIEIGEYGSISKAAQNLHLSQPYLSKLVKEVENEFQISLFTRSKQGITLTESGRLFIDMGQELQRNMDNFQSVFHSHLEYEYLRVSSHTFSHPFDTFVQMLQEMGDEKLRCVFRETTNDAVINDIYTNDADLGILLLNQRNWWDVQKILEIRRIACHILCTSKGYLLARNGHPLLTIGKPISAEDIYQYNFVFYETQRNNRDYLRDNIYMNDTVNLIDRDKIRQLVYVTSRAALREILLRTDYLSIGLTNVQNQEPNMGLVSFPLPNELISLRPNSGHYFCYIHLKSRKLSPICKRFINCLEKHYGGILEVPLPPETMD